MVKVLHYIYGLNVGGAESFIYNFLRSIPEKQYIFDFCIQSEKNENENLIELIKDRGGKIHHISPYNKNPLKNKLDFERLIKGENYEIIHFHMNSLINTKPLYICNKYGLKMVVHSHNTKSNGGFIGQIMHRINQVRIKHLDFKKVACGREAGEWFYGVDDFDIITNGIVIDDYRYSIERRTSIRETLQIRKSTLVIGHVGRFTYAKNHDFIIEIFKEIHKMKPDVKLILIGDGELKESIQAKICNLNLQQFVLLTGNVSNVADYLSAFDILVFPSHFEGLPFALIEAQASGLQIIGSDVISPDARISDLLEFKSLKENKYEWAKSVLKMADREVERLDYSETVSESKYNSVISAKKVCEIYEELRGEKE